MHYSVKICIKTYSEKISWLKLNVREPIQTLCADKFLVRDFIKETIGEKYLIPLLFQTYDVEELIPENLPDIPFIIKTNHDSQKPIIIHDKKNHEFLSELFSFMNEKEEKILAK